MYIIQSYPDRIGAYPPIQSWDGSAPPAGYAEVPESLDLTEFYQYNGFVTLTVENGVVTAVTPNAEEWEAWKAAQLATEPEPVSEVEQLRADVDFVAVMTGVTL